MSTSFSSGPPLKFNKRHSGSMSAESKIEENREVLEAIASDEDLEVQKYAQALTRIGGR